MIGDRDKCVVKGCVNRKIQGRFVGDICSPCFSYITNGKIGPTTSFLGDMKKNAYLCQGRIP